MVCHEPIATVAVYLVREGATMNCERCGNDIGTDSTSCRHCGGGRHENHPSSRLYRLPVQGRIGGVCAGFADYFETDVTFIRFLWVVFSIVPGAFIGCAIVYVAASLVTPVSNAPVQTDTGARLTRSPLDRKIAGVCGGIAEYLGVDPTLVRLGWVVLTVVPGAIVLGIVAYVVAWFIMPERHVAPMVTSPHAV